MRKILLVTDVQKAFVIKQLEDKLNSRAIKNINKLINSNVFDEIIATKFVNTPTSPFSKLMDWHKVTGDPDTLFMFDTDKQLHVVEKETYTLDSSVDLDGVTLTPSDTVYIVGFDTDACVYATALTLFDKGIQPLIIEDACYSSGGHVIHSAGMCLLERNLGSINILDTISVLS